MGDPALGVPECLLQEESPASDARLTHATQQSSVLRAGWVRAWGQASSPQGVSLGPIWVSGGVCLMRGGTSVHPQKTASPP